MNFQEERKHFWDLKKKVSKDNLKEYKDAITELHSRYNTTIHENRFVVGGAVKLFTVALLRSVGIDAKPCGNKAVAGDIILPTELPTEKMLSVKGHFTGKKGEIRLVNTMGDGSRTEWNTATLFIVSGKGIIYGDPTMVDDNDIIRKKDAITLKYRAVEELYKNNCIAANIPHKRPSKQAGSSQRASVAVAKQILNDCKLSGLNNQFKDYE